ncbi:MAG: addiction module protein [Pirellulaceae bacterium]
MSVDINELKNLPTSEKLRLVELLWDDISASNEPIVLHSWQFSEATRRGSELRADPAIAIDRDELWRRVNG